MITDKENLRHLLKTVGLSPRLTKWCKRQGASPGFKVRVVGYDASAPAPWEVEDRTRTARIAVDTDWLRALKPTKSKKAKVAARVAKRRERARRAKAARLKRGRSVRRTIYTLYKALDDINTAGDIAKEDDKLFRRMTQRYVDEAMERHGMPQERIEKLYDLYYGPERKASRAKELAAEIMAHPQYKSATPDKANVSHTVRATLRSIANGNEPNSPHRHVWTRRDVEVLCQRFGFAYQWQHYPNRQSIHRFSLWHSLWVAAAEEETEDLCILAALKHMLDVAEGKVDHNEE